MKRLLSIFIFLLFIFSQNVFAQSSASIDINCASDLGSINYLIFGNNVLGHDPANIVANGQHYYGYADYGSGLWDPVTKKNPAEVFSLAQSIGISALRFPGGCGSHGYDWKEAIWPYRTHFLFGIDEFMKTCNNLGATPIFTISYFTGDWQDAANFVEYLNSPNDGNHFWASIRNYKGRSAPYGVKYFEIGNEIWHGDHLNIPSVSASEYVQKYFNYYSYMKAVDSTIKIGVPIQDQAWAGQVASVIQDKVDFAIVHLYPTPAWEDALAKLTEKEIFETSFAMSSVWYGYFLQDISKTLQTSAGKKVPLAITEYNGGYSQELPVPYRFTLGCALVNAEIIRTLMRPESNVCMANYWNFANEYWGMVSNGFTGNAANLYDTYFKRPNYYVLELYRQHFGKYLLPYEYTCDSYNLLKYKNYNKLVDKNIVGLMPLSGLASQDWSITDLSGVNASQSQGILTVTFNSPIDYNYYHCKKRIAVKPRTYYRLSAFIKTQNLNAAEGICLQVQDSRGWDLTQSAASTQKILGSNDWIYVETVYQTLPDTQNVDIFLRNSSNVAPLFGIVQVRGVQLDEFSPANNEIINGTISTAWKVDSVPGVITDETNNILTINFANTTQYNYYHCKKTASVRPSTYYRLSGYIKTENLNAPKGIGLEVQDIRGYQSTQWAVPTQKFLGNNDWQALDLVFKTLAGTTGINIIARNVSSVAPLNGIVRFSNIQVDEFSPFRTTSKEDDITSPWVIIPVDGVTGSDVSGVFTINFNNPQQVNYFQSFKQTTVIPNTYYRLSGYVKTDNLVSASGICLEMQDSRGFNVVNWSGQTSYLSGTNDWKYIEGTFKVPEGTSDVKIFVRNPTSTGSLSGQAQVRNMRLDKIKPVSDGLGYGLLPSNWDITDFSSTTVNDAQGVLTVNFQNPLQYNYFHSSKTVPVKPGSYYRLSGYMRTDNFNSVNGICLEAQDSRGYTTTQWAKQTPKVKGTIDWKYVETTFQALPDAQALKIMLRNAASSGPLSGIVQVKNIRLDEYIQVKDTRVPYLSVNVSRSTDAKKVYLMVVNRSMDNNIETKIQLNSFTPAGTAHAWTLNGSSISATNENIHDNVKVTPTTFSVSGPVFNYVFPAHSLTAIELDSAS